MKTIEQQIGEALAKEDGGFFGFVSIWRQKDDPLDDNSDSARKCTVGEFLSQPKNQAGTWLIDGGWGGPPGPVHVRWNEETKEWENGGFCGRRFKNEDA